MEKANQTLGMISKSFESRMVTVITAKFIQSDFTVPTPQCRKVFDEAAAISIHSSRRVFMARNCPEWWVDTYSFCFVFVGVFCVCYVFVFSVPLAMPTCM